MGGDCFLSLRPVGHWEGLNNTLLDFLVNNLGMGMVVSCLCGLLATGRGLEIFYWNFSAKQLGRGMVVSCLCGLSATWID